MRTRQFTQWAIVAGVLLLLGAVVASRDATITTAASSDSSFANRYVP